MTKTAICSLFIVGILISQTASAQIAEGKAKFLGSAYSFSQSERFLNYWNQVTPENSGKWGSVEGTRDQFNWTQLDEAYNLAKNNDLPFHFHVLVWGNQQPQWMKSLSSEEQLEEITEWFEAVAERYPDIDFLEVVNEPLHDPPNNVGNNAGDNGSGGYIDALGGSGATGWDWILTAFEMAREIFPDSVKLMINDYGIISNPNATNTYKGIIELLKERGLIDIIGVQGHAFNNGGSAQSGTTPATIKSNLDILGELGFPIQVTELDIDGDPNADDDTSQEVQLARYKRIFPIFWEHPKVEGVTLWGWLPGHWRSSQEAYIFDSRPRDAMEWLEDYVDTANVVLQVPNEILKEVPQQIVLNQNYPNPFNPSTSISYTIPAASEVRITVYDLTGREIQTLVNERKGAGNHTISFNASNLSTGVYFYEIRSGTFREVKKMTLIK